MVSLSAGGCVISAPGPPDVLEDAGKPGGSCHGHRDREKGGEREEQLPPF